jgi:hypothetical protein
MVMVENHSLPNTIDPANIEKPAFRRVKTAYTKRLGPRPFLERTWISFKAFPVPIATQEIASSAT